MLLRETTKTNWLTSEAQMPLRKYLDVAVGAKYGRLTVLAPAPKIQYKDGHEYWAWLCRCECGIEKVIKDSSLKAGITQSCGCLQLEKARLAATWATRHGEGANGRETPEYISWLGLNRRARNPNRKNYHCWDGVEVCERWLVYENFLADMGRRPTKKHSIDRIENEGHYSCGKCSQCLRNGWPFNGRWATSAEQARNRSDNHFLTIGAETLCIEDWEITRGLPKGLVRGRVSAGWLIDENILRPPHRKAA